MRKYIMILMVRVVFRILYIFPVKKNRVFLTSFNGRKYSCSPKYIAEALLKKGGYDILFAMKKGVIDEIPANIKIVTYKSLKYFYYIMTSKYIVINSTGIANYLPYRKNQLLINTWHGNSAFKTTGNDVFKNKYDMKLRKIAGKNVAVYLSNGRLFTKQHSQAHCISEEKFYNIGLPRNDVFFENHPEIVEKVYKKLSIEDKKKIILYAPTYRDGEVRSLQGYGFENINVERVIFTCNEKFGKDYVFVFKAHHNMLPDNIGNSVINASEYADIQELLYVADILITDYSSCMWDFALQNKPGFLYAPDIKEYEEVHPLGSPVEEWPYPMAMSMVELEGCIWDYNQNRAQKRIEDFFEKFGNYDKGNAMETLYKEIFE